MISCYYWPLFHVMRFATFHFFDCGVCGHIKAWWDNHVNVYVILLAPGCLLLWLVITGPRRFGFLQVRENFTLQDDKPWRWKSWSKYVHQAPVTSHREPDISQLYQAPVNQAPVHQAPGSLLTVNQAHCYQASGNQAPGNQLPVIPDVQQDTLEFWSFIIKWASELKMFLKDIVTNTARL